MQELKLNSLYPKIDRRQLLGGTWSTVQLLLLANLMNSQRAIGAPGQAERIIFVYHPDGVVPDRWHSNSTDNLPIAFLHYHLLRTS